jgi:succinoglycan biosynthesis protein ExoO
MTVSVVIPMYNAEAFVAVAVASALAQTAPVHEVLLVDDASTDGTVSTARALARRHPEVRVLEVAVNSGPAHARNVAFEAATGEWLAVLDADDTMSPGRLAAMLEAAAATGAEVVVDNFVFVNAADGSVRPSRIPGGPGWEELSRYDFLRAARAFNRQPTWTLLQPLVRKDFLDRHGIRYPEAGRHGEDFVFMLDVLLCGARCVRVRNPGYLYTERRGGLSTTRTDYSGLVAQTEGLLQDPRVRSDPRARRLLRRRLATLRCLSAERQGRAHLLRAAVRPGVAATLLRRLGRRAVAVVRPPADPVPPLL